MSVLVVLVLGSPGVMVSGVARELDVLIHPKVVLDVLLHIDVTEARSYVRPVCLGMVVVRVTRVTRVARVVGRLLVLPSLQRGDLARLLLGESSLQHRAGAGAAGRCWTVRTLLTGSCSAGREELPVLKVVGRHQGLVGRHWGGRSPGVVWAGVARSRGRDGGQGGHVGGGHVGGECGALVVFTTASLVTHQWRVRVVGVVVKRRPRVAWEPVGSEMWRHVGGVRGHPRVQPDPLHHLGVLLGTELRPEAVWRWTPVSDHVPVILLGGTVGRPAALLKELVSQWRHSPGHKLGAVGPSPQPHVVGEGIARGERRVRESLHDTIR